MKYYLVDNGSYRAESYRNLQSIASRLTERVGEEILPVSLLHSNRIDPADLGGKAADTWEPRIKKDLSEGERGFCVIPFFFGRTGAILDYMPERSSKLKEEFEDFNLQRTSFLGGETCIPEPDLLSILADNIQSTAREAELKEPPAVVLVDHGSPQEVVASLRDNITQALNVHFKDRFAGVWPASMERRDGKQYAFNEPLLETILRRPNLAKSPVILSMLFLSRGRHAGPGGDIDTIVNEAKEEIPELEVFQSPLVADHERVIELLENRFRGKRYTI